jgi:hypothetical protein
MNDPFKFIIENVQLDLETGPYITGSRLTYEFEKLFRVPNYQPKDVDVVCRNEDQKITVEKVLKKHYFLSGTDSLFIPKAPWRVIKEENLTVFKYKSRTRNSKIDLVVVNVSAQEKINSHDFNISKIACCNKYTIAHENCFSDIKNKNLNIVFHYLPSNEPLETIWVKSGFLFRLDKYKKRGYKPSPELISYFEKYEN